MKKPKLDRFGYPVTKPIHLGPIAAGESTNPLRLPDPPDAADDAREAGIAAIIALQKLAGITEPRERAERHWDNFKPWEKERTMQVYRACCR